MNVRPYSDVMVEIFEDYDRHPEGWHAFALLDKRYRMNLFITNRDYLWQLKMEPHIGVGLKIEGENEVKNFVQSLNISFGVRQLPDALRERVFKELREFGYVTPRTNRNIQSYAPQKSDEIENSEHAFAATILTPTNVVFVPNTEQTQEVDRLLDKELERAVRQRYSMYA